MSVVQPNFNFSMTKGVDDVEIDVVPPPATKTRLFLTLGGAFMGLFIGLIGGLIVFAGFMSSFLPAFLVTLLVLASTFGCAAYFYRANGRAVDERLRPARIKVNRDGITLNGQTYLRAHVSKVFMDGPGERIEIEVTNQASFGREVARAMNRSFEERAFGVKMRYAGDHVTLVDALPRATAEAVYGEITSAFVKFA